MVRQLDVKHGPRVHRLPGALPGDLPERVTFNIKSFQKRYSELKPLSGAGLASSMTCPRAAQAVVRHKDFAEHFVNVDLPSWYYWIATATKMIALIKSPPTVEGGTPDVRPIGMGGCKRRAWTSCLMKDNRDIFKKPFWPVQVACAIESGVMKLIFGTTEHMRNNRTHVLLKFDFSNAFNTVWRSAVLKACYDNPSWRHLYRFLWCTLSPKSDIASGYQQSLMRRDATRRFGRGSTGFNL